MKTFVRNNSNEGVIYTGEVFTTPVKIVRSKPLKSVDSTLQMSVAKRHALKSIDRAFAELKLMQEGKLQGIPAENLINEL